MWMRLLRREGTERGVDESGVKCEDRIAKSGTPKRDTDR